MHVVASVLRGETRPAVLSLSKVSLGQGEDRGHTGDQGTALRGPGTQRDPGPSGDSMMTGVP